MIDGQWNIRLLSRPRGIFQLSKYFVAQDDDVDVKKQKTENGTHEENGEEEEDAEEEEDLGDEEEDLDGEGEDELDEEDGGEGEH